MSIGVFQFLFRSSWFRTIRSTLGVLLTFRWCRLRRDLRRRLISSCGWLVLIDRDDALKLLISIMIGYLFDNYERRICTAMYNIIVIIVKWTKCKREANEKQQESTRWCTLFDHMSSVGCLFRREVSVNHSFVGKLVFLAHEQIVVGLQGTAESFFKPSLRLEREDRHSSQSVISESHVSERRRKGIDSITLTNRLVQQWMLVQIVANRHRVKLERNVHRHQTNRCDNVGLDDTNSSTARNREWNDFWSEHRMIITFLTSLVWYFRNWAKKPGFGWM